MVYQISLKIEKGIFGLVLFLAYTFLMEEFSEILPIMKIMKVTGSGQ